MVWQCSGFPLTLPCAGPLSWTSALLTQLLFNICLFTIMKFCQPRLKRSVYPGFYDQSEPSPRLIYHSSLMGLAHPEQWFFEGSIHLSFTPSPVNSKTALPREGLELGCPARGFILCRSLKYFLDKGLLNSLYHLNNSSISMTS